MKSLTFRLLLICLCFQFFSCEHNSCEHFANLNTLRNWHWQGLEERKINLLKSNYQSEVSTENPNTLRFNSCLSSFEAIEYNQNDLTANSIDYWTGNGRHFVEMQEQLKETQEFEEQNSTNDSLRSYINQDWGEKITFSEFRTNPILYGVTFFRDSSLVVLEDYNFYHKFFRWTCADNLNTTLPTKVFGFGSGIRHGVLFPIALIGKITGARNNVYGGWAKTTEFYWIGLIFGFFIFVFISQMIYVIWKGGN